MRNIDEVIEGSSDPVEPYVSIDTGNGIISIAGLAFVGTAPADDMPNSISVRRQGGNAPAKATYFHESTVSDMNKSLTNEQSRISDTLRTTASLRTQLTAANRAISDLKEANALQADTITRQRAIFLKLPMPPRMPSPTIKRSFMSRLREQIGLNP